MNRLAARLRPLWGSRLSQRPLQWAGLALLLSFGVCAAMAWLHFQQRSVLAHTTRSVERVRQARIDLAKGFVHLNLGGEPGLPFDRGQGAALIDQALRVLDRALAESAALGLLDRTERGWSETFRTEHAALRAALAGEASAAAPRPARMTEVRIAFHRLEAWADDLDEITRRELRDLSERQDRRFNLTVTAAATVLLGICAGVFVVTRAQRAAMLALWRNERQLQLFIEHVPAALAMFDRDMRYIVASQRWREDYRLGDRQLVGLSHYVVLPEIGEAWREVHQRGLAGEIVRHEGDRFVMADGTELWLRWEVRPWYDDGNAVGGIAVFAEDITAQHEAQEALRESEARLETVIENLTEGLVLGDPEGRLLQWNRAIVEMLEMTEVTTFGRRMSEFRSLVTLHEPDGTLVPYEQWPMARVLRGERLRHHEMELRRIGSNWRRVFEYNGDLLRDGAGRPLALLSIMDITGRKRAEEQLRANEALLRETGHIAKVGGWSLDLRTAETTFTEEVARIHDVPPEVLHSLEAALSMYDEPSRRRIDHAIRQAVEHGTPYELELALTTPAGRRKWVRTIARPVHEDGRVVSIRGAIQDITDRRRAEEALRESESRFRQIAESLPQLVWTCDAAGACDYLSPQWVAYTGVPEHEQLGFGWAERVHPEDRQRTVETWMETAGRGQVVRLEFRIRRHDGQYRWFDARAVPLRAADGALVKWFGSNTDIDDDRRLREELRQLNTELEQRVAERTAQLQAANGELEAFSYSVSHDLRAPLRAVDGFSHALLEDFGPRLPPEAQRYLGLIRQGAQRMGQLIDDLLSFSRLGRAPIALVQVDTARMVREVVDELVTAGAARQLEVQMGELPPCVGDPALLRQVWVNLLSNAFKYTRRRPVAKIAVAGRIEADRIVFSVSDNGTGFDMAYAHKLFGVFQRLHREEEFEGTGVGLAIVQRVIMRHGGAVWAQAEPDRGATFLFCLPNPQPGSS